MKKSILTLFSVAVMGATIQAQDIANCKNTCEKSTIVLEGVFLGVQINNGPTGTNAQILRVFENTAAEKNKLAVGDVIMSIDKDQVLDKDHLVRLIKSHKANDVVTITYSHNDAIVSKKVKLGAEKTTVKKEMICCDAAPEVNILSVFPNPSSDVLNVKYRNETKEALTLKIYTNDGREVESMNFDKDINLENHSIRTYSDAEYLINVSNSKINLTERFFKVSK